MTSVVVQAFRPSQRQDLKVCTTFKRKTLKACELAMPPAVVELAAIVPAPTIPVGARRTTHPSSWDPATLVAHPAVVARLPEGVAIVDRGSDHHRRRPHDNGRRDNDGRRHSEVKREMRVSPRAWRSDDYAQHRQACDQANNCSSHVVPPATAKGASRMPGQRDDF